MDQRIPTVLAPIFECYLSLINQRLPNFLGSFYIVGSIALDEFNPHVSDVDFVAGIGHPATDDEIHVLKEIHKEVDRRYPRWKLSGIYLLEHGLGKDQGEAEKCIGYHDGVLQFQGNFESNPVTWWILKNHGIPLLGPDPHDLPITVDAKVLVAWTRENMNTYWKSWTRRPDRLIILLTDWGVQWAVLGVARQFYTIRENKIISKRRAGDYALSAVPHRWHRIINEAIRIRTNSKGFLYRSRLARTINAVNFMNYIIQTSNDGLEGIRHE